MGTRTIEWCCYEGIPDGKYRIRVERKAGNRYLSEVLNIWVENGLVTRGISEKELAPPVKEGTITILGSGDQTYYHGEDIKFSGMNRITDVTYLFITGKDLPEDGGMLKAPRIGINNGQSSSFDQADVYEDDIWVFKWYTKNLDINPGTYTIYASANPTSVKALKSGQYDTTSIVIKAPYIFATVSESVVAKGDSLALRGVAEGGPTKGVQIWIFGDNFFHYGTVGVNDDMSFEYTLQGDMTAIMDSGTYYVVLQHPMYNNEFDVYPDGPISPQYVLGSQPTSGTPLFKIGGDEALLGIDGAQTLVNLIDIIECDDTVTMLQFVIEEPIALTPIDTIPSAIIGDIGGTTQEEIQSEFHNQYGGKPDVFISDLAMIYNAKSREIPVTLTINNQGSSKAGAMNIAYFLTKEKIVHPFMDSSDNEYILARDSVNGLEPGEKRESSSAKFLTIDMIIPSGIYWFGAYIDSGNVIDEYDDENNVRYGEKEIVIE